MAWEYGLLLPDPCFRTDPLLVHTDEVELPFFAVPFVLLDDELFKLASRFIQDAKGLLRAFRSAR